MKIFIDANEYQRFIRTTKPDLGDLKILKKILKKPGKEGTKPYTLVTTEQVIDEYYREEDVQIKSNRKKISEKKVAFALFEKPTDKQSVHEKALVERAKKIESSFDALVKKEMASFDKKSGEVKRLMEDLFKLAGNPIACDDDILRAVEIRLSQGKYPPKTNGSIGDAINWEILLSQPDDVEYVFITKDTDFVTEDGSLRKSLQIEWDKDHSEKIKIYPYIGDFLEAIGEKKKLTVSKRPQILKKTSTEEGLLESSSNLVSVSDSSTMWVVPKTVTGGTYLVNPASVAGTNWTTVSGAGSTFTSSGANNFFTNVATVNVNFCPSCGAEKNQLVRLNTTAFYFSKNSYKCLTCGNTFEV